jgi:hypothetical protein
MDKSTVSGGGVGVFGAYQSAFIRTNSVVNTFVKAPYIHILTGATVANSIPGAADINLPEFIFNESGCKDEFEVDGGETAFITNNTFGDIQLEENATLIVNTPEFIHGGT